MNQENFASRLNFIIPVLMVAGIAINALFGNPIGGLVESATEDIEMPVIDFNE